MRMFGRFGLNAAACIALTAMSQGIRAADISGLQAGGMPPQLPWAYGHGGFDPTLDPRCRIVALPEASLYGETARFRPTAVCQSRGLYVDSVVVP